MVADKISIAAGMIKKSAYAIAFTGAGISVESGIPPFRGKNGLWNKYDPNCLDLHNYLNDPVATWRIIRELFYDFFGKAKANEAHLALARLELSGLLKLVITQNIDNLHHQAGSKNIIEFHGHTRSFTCVVCHKITDKNKVELNAPFPVCPECDGLLKPDFVFFGEAIPEPAGSLSFKEAVKCDLVIVIGTSGEVMPACEIPYLAKRNGAKIIEINTEPSLYTPQVTDIFLQGQATEMMNKLMEKLGEL